MNETRYVVTIPVTLLKDRPILKTIEHIGFLPLCVKGGVSKTPFICLICLNI
jgi:hypothetical protein